MEATLQSPSPFVGLICAAGVGSRMQADRPKQYLPLCDVPMLVRTARALVQDVRLREVVIVVSPEDPYIDEIAGELPDRTRILRVGGATRHQSVLNGLMNSGFNEHDWVLVHDAARPCLDKADLCALMDEVVTPSCEAVGAILASPVADTLKRVTPEGFIEKTISRDGLWRAATPQLFRFNTLVEALTQTDVTVTDEASAVEALGQPIRVVTCQSTNLKVTQPSDKTLVEGILGGTMPEFRVGQGYDSHRLVAGRPLIVGGVTIPYEKGLLGHSDADVLLHAITDAVLGAASLGDIGEHFPPSDDRFKGADSATLLAEVVRRAKDKGFTVVNCDATIIAEAPKMGPHRPAMKARIAELLQVDQDAVNIKAKTNEQMDAVGAGDGMMAQAVVLMRR